jgi:hypothetical protein
MPESLAQFVDKYLAWGFCLIPIVPRAKNPSVKWQQYQGHKPTEAEISAWFSSNNANIGIVCGTISGNLIVLDFDNQELYVGFSDFWLEKYGRKIDEMTPIVQTGGGGYHVYLRVRQLPQLFHPTGADRKHIPDIQSQGGYVLAPPSLHPSGNPYRLLNPQVTTIFEVESLREIAIDIPSKHEAQRQTRQKGEPHWVTKALAGAPQGERDQTCIKLAGYFRNKHPQEITEVILLDFADKCNPPLAEVAVRKCINSAYSYESEAEEPSENVEATPRLPELAWRGLFADYRELVAPTTEAADEYHFATFCQVLGCTLARRVHVYHAGMAYPNFYICLVGRSGLTRKDTCWNRARSILSSLHAEQGDEAPVFRMVRGIRSYEGLLDELSGLRKVRLIQVGELLSLLSKAKQDSQGNILPALTELYDCPDRVNPPVRGKPADCREPFVSIMAGTTLAWLCKALTEADILGGFANRWLFFCGTPKSPKPNPPRVNKDKRDSLVENINLVRAWADRLPNGGETHLSGEAGALFEGYYIDYYHRCQNEGLIPTLIVRVQDYIIKLALLYAAIERSPEITADHMTAALAVGNYLEASIREVFRNFGASSEKEHETKLLAYLKSQGKPLQKRTVYQMLNMAARELENICQPLAKSGLIKITKAKNKMGRYVEFVEVL